MFSSVVAMKVDPSVIAILMPKLIVQSRNAMLRKHACVIAFKGIDQLWVIWVTMPKLGRKEMRANSAPTRAPGQQGKRGAAASRPQCGASSEAPPSPVDNKR